METKMKRKFRIKIGDNEYIVDVEELTDAENGEDAEQNKADTAPAVKKNTAAQDKKDLL